MSAYLVSWTDFVENVQVLRFADVKPAMDYSFEKLEQNRTAHVFAVEADMMDVSGGVMVKLYNHLVPDATIQKFSTKAEAARRTWNTLDNAHKNDPLTLGNSTTSEEPADYGHPAIKGVTWTPDEPPAVEPTSEPTSEPTPEPVPPAEPVAKTPKTPKTPKEPRTPKAHPAKSPAEFKQVRRGTDRARVLELMNGTLTPEEIAQEVFPLKGGKYTLAHAHCLHRDDGIGYELVEGKFLLALYPEGKSFTDAIKPEKE